MCIAVLEVRYKAQGEPAQLLRFPSEAELDKRLEEIRALEGVAGYTIFRPAQRLERVSTWAQSPVGVA